MADEKIGAAKPLMTWGLVGTGAYLLFLLALAWVKWPMLGDLEPNEFGDLLAGIFSPLAFLWLVLGFMQQGHELRQSSQALWLQGEELRNSVEQQRELVDVTRQQLELERDQREKAELEAAREDLPTLALIVSDKYLFASGAQRYTFKLFNSGTRCSLLKIFHDINLIAGRDDFPNAHMIEFILDFDDSVKKAFVISVGFIDRRGRNVLQKFQLIPIDFYDPPTLNITPQTPVIDEDPF